MLAQVGYDITKILRHGYARDAAATVDSRFSKAMSQPNPERQLHLDCCFTRRQSGFRERAV